MGTETLYMSMHPTILILMSVKLNNPLMGTETQLLHIVDYH